LKALSREKPIAAVLKSVRNLIKCFMLIQL
jgi:hypothetical protein